MRKVLFIAVLVLISGSLAAAQDYPKAEVFGGFTFTHLDTEGAKVPADAPAGTSIKNWYPGWEATGQFNLTKMFGLAADISGSYGKPVSVPGVSDIPSARVYNFLFGPVVSFRGDRFTPFVHGLFGIDHLSVGSTTISLPQFPTSTSGYSENAFGMEFGGGVDVKISHHFAYRLGQFDYLFTKHCLAVAGTCTLGVGSAPPAHQNNFRFATGIVIH